MRCYVGTVGIAVYSAHYRWHWSGFRVPGAVVVAGEAWRRARTDRLAVEEGRKKELELEKEIGVGNKAESILGSISVREDDSVI
jgi:hypothetical protein